MTATHSTETAHGGFPPPASDLPVLLTTGQLSERIGVSFSTLSHWRVAGIGPAFHRLPNGKIKYNVETVAAWLEEHRAQSTAGAKR
jgi:predicted site-specific integrase-resolvase